MGIPQEQRTKRPEPVCAGVDAGEGRALECCCQDAHSRHHGQKREIKRPRGSCACQCQCASQCQCQSLKSRCDCGVAIVAIVGMRVWISMRLLPRSLFSRVQEPTAQSRARRARDTGLNGGGQRIEESRTAGRCRDCKGSRQYPIKDQESRISGSCRVQRLQVVANHHPRLPMPWLGSRHLGRNRQAENRRSKQSQSEYDSPCL
jgi:hypothetical protein